MKISLLFLALTYAQCTFAAFSGVYIDNGKGQTVMQRGISRKEKLQFQRDMLDLLGLPDKPRRRFNSSDLSASAPKFLLDLYKSMDGSKMKDDFNLKKEDLRSIKESDSIMTFLSKNDRVNAVRHERGKRLWFDVSDVPLGDTLVGAEVRLYRVLDEDSEDEEPLTVTMYQVIEDLNGEKELAFADAVNVTSNYKGWLVFNVTSAFLSWVAFPTSNRGLYISVQRQAEPNYEMHPEEAGIISVVYEDEENQPFVAAFFKYGSSSRRRIREAPAPKRRNRKSNADVSVNSNPLTESLWTLRHCQIQSLYVNFKDLEWQEWIIAPDGYAAYYCSGICDFPLNAHMNATNHAIVQTLVHLIDPGQAPKPCCAPSKLGSMSVLYYLEDNNVMMKKFKNMIVKSCGCH